MHACIHRRLWAHTAHAHKRKHTQRSMAMPGRDAGLRTLSSTHMRLRSTGRLPLEGAQDRAERRPGPAGRRIPRKYVQSAPLPPTAMVWKPAAATVTILLPSNTSATSSIGNSLSCSSLWPRRPKAPQPRSTRAPPGCRHHHHSTPPLRSSRPRAARRPPA
jgi:hypothetical protein